MSKHTPQLKPGDLFFLDINATEKVMGMILEVYKSSYRYVWLDKEFRGKIVREDAIYIDNLYGVKW